MKLFLALVQTLEEFKAKARVLGPSFDLLLKEQQVGNSGKIFINSERIVLGFYFVFIYKDFTLRELVA